MPELIVQPPVINSTLEDIINFWNNGVNAAHVNMMYATIAARAGIIPDTSFAEIAVAQMPLIEHIEQERRALSKAKSELSEAEQFAISAFGHDLLTRASLFIKSWSSVSKIQGTYERWLKVASICYSPIPSLHQYLHGLADSRLLERSDKGISVAVLIDNDFTLRNVERFSKARVIFENLIDNAIKYGEGTIVISGNGNDLIFENEGIGMDPAFAARLGKGEQIREERAEGVEGEGIGWASIGKLMGELGWSWDIETGIDKGAKITVHMIEGDLIPLEVASAQSSGQVQITGMVPADEIIRSAVMFRGARPFDGYDMMNGPDGAYLSRINIICSPIFPAIMRANILAGPWMGMPFFMPSGPLPWKLM